MTRATFDDHVLTSLAIKPDGKFVNLAHILEKVSRDGRRKFSEDETKKLLDSLVKKGWVEERAREYVITSTGREYFERRWRQIRDELNPEYLKIYRAKRYYPHVVDALLEFCHGRWVSVFRLFTGRAWLQRKLGPKYITIESVNDVEKWLDAHGIDFIPYIHKVGGDRPDWLVIDFDAGKEVQMEKTKAVLKVAHDVLVDLKVEPSIKYSGSRGFQLWAQFKPHELPNVYKPIKLRTEKRERNFFSFYADLIRFVESKVARQLPGLTTAETAYKAAREDKVLFDASIIKPMGDVRAPYSMHFKTGLISMPLNYKEIESFDPNVADPEKVVKRYVTNGNEFILKSVDGNEFFDAALNWFNSR